MRRLSILEDRQMIVSNRVGRIARTLSFTTAIVAAIGLTTAPQPAHALSSGAAVGIGLGALAVGTALGAAGAAPAPSPYYYNGYSYPPGYYYGPAQPSYPYYPTGSCWSPVYGRYMPC
jgi:hypothetical protein